MVWFKVDDNLAFNSKAVMAGNSALGGWVRAGSWCAQQLTDGRVPDSILSLLGMRKRDADALVQAGLWHEVDGGYQFHAWSEYQPTKEEVEAERAANRKRQRRHRDNAVSNGVTNGVTNTVSTPVSHGTPTRPAPTNKESGARKRGTRLPENWLPSPLTRQAMAKEFPSVDLKMEHDKFTDYWAAKAGKDGTKLDWDATWRNWIRNSRPDSKPTNVHQLPTAYVETQPEDPESLPW